jgi:hypothetical protein
MMLIRVAKVALQDPTVATGTVAPPVVGRVFAYARGNPEVAEKLLQGRLIQSFFGLEVGDLVCASLRSEDGRGGVAGHEYQEEDEGD